MTRRPFSVQRALIAMLLLVAVIERFAWAARRGWITTAGEATSVAKAVAQGRGFADAYFVGSGPTAHLMPTTPLLAGGVYRLLGSNVLAEIVLQVIASVEMIAGYLLLYALFTRMGMALIARLAALTTLCLLPVFLGQESLDYRYWEGGTAVVLATACLIIIVDIDLQVEQPSKRQVAQFALLFASTFFTSPSLGLAIGACSLILLFKHPQWRHRIAMVSVATLALALLLTPWVIRNDQVLGKPILLRSNMPLELTIANNDWQAAQASKQTFDASMLAAHPTAPGPGKLRVRQVGEVAYMAELSKRTDTWITRHPYQFAALCARHARQMFFPDPFQFEIGGGNFSKVRATWYGVVSSFGLIALALGVRRRMIGYLYVIITVAIVAATYLPFQPMARYLYLNYGLLVFSAMQLVVEAAERLARMWHHPTSITAGTSR